MKAQALVPALALAAALLALPPAEADSRHRTERRGRASAHGDYDRRPSHGSHGYRSNPGYYARGYRPSHRSHGYGYRPYYRSPRYYAPPPANYGFGYGGYGYGGYDAYGYGYYPPPPRYYAPRPRFGIWIGF